MVTQYEGEDKKNWIVKSLDGQMMMWISAPDIDEALLIAEIFLGECKITQA